MFENQKEALDLLKQFRSARFKVFDNYDAALEFAQDYAIECEPAPDSNVVSQSTKTETDSQKSKPLEASFESVGKQFPSLKENLLTRFRRAIESGNMSFVVECVESNPKYLISSCETPVILFAGNRYNAVHCACKANQVDILRYVLDKISDEQYVNRMFEDRNPYTATARCVHLLDFYLNTPDKIVHLLFNFQFNPF